MDRLVLQHCESLAELPATLHVKSLDVSDCPQLAEIPIGVAAGLRRLTARDCRRLAALPANLRVTHLDVGGCERLAEIASGALPFDGAPIPPARAPLMRTCRQAIAWTPGFDDAELYRPLVET